LNQEQQRFRQLMLCLPEVRSIAGRLQELQLDKVPLMLKALLHTIKVSNPVQQQTVQPPPVQQNSFQHHVQQTIQAQLSKGKPENKINNNNNPVQIHTGNVPVVSMANVVQQQVNRMSNNSDSLGTSQPNVQ